MIYISLTVHEHPMFLVYQLSNIDKTYKEDYKVVLHISKNSKDYLQEFNKLHKLVSNLDKVVINTNNTQTNWGYILQSHISNFNFVKHEEFDKFVLMSSNEFIINDNISQHIHNFDFGCDVLNIRRGDGWCWSNKVLSDDKLLNLFTKYGISPYASYHEGTFYSKAILESIINICEEYTDWFGVLYPREEVFFPSISNSLFTGSIRTTHFSVVYPYSIPLITENLIIDINGGKIKNKFSIKGFKRNTTIKTNHLLRSLQRLDLI